MLSPKDHLKSIQSIEFFAEPRFQLTESCKAWSISYVSVTTILGVRRMWSSCIDLTLSKSQPWLLQLFCSVKINYGLILEALGG